MDVFKATFNNPWADITVKELAAILGNFLKRVQACIKSTGGHFEEHKIKES